MRPFEYRRAAHSREAIALCTGPEEEAKLLAGGTDLIPLMKDGVLHPRRLVDIKRAADVPGDIRASDHGITIGALATLADVADHAAISSHAAMLAEAAQAAATPQLRAMATVGGNLLQRPRCWYYRNSHFHCWLAGGERCQAREGRNDRHAIFESDDENPCCAVHPSDLAPCLVALDAQVLLRDEDGAERALPVEHLFAPPSPERRTETRLGREIVVEVRLPALSPGTRGCFRKAMSRSAWGFALSSVAARVDLEDGRIAEARLVLGGVASVPWRARQAEQALRERSLAGDVVRRAADLAVADARPLGHNAYKVPLTRGLVIEALDAMSR